MLDYQELLSRPPAHVIALAGYDPTGGAGLVRDHVTATALGVALTGIPTALTRQGWLAPDDAESAFEARAPGHVLADLERTLRRAHGRDAAYPAGARVALKIGMVGTASLARALAQALGREPLGHGLPVVFDPVLFSSSGLVLFRHDDEDGLSLLLARATLVTPNLAELAMLSARPVTSLQQALDAAHGLVAAGAVRALLVKGGHLHDDPVLDVLVTSSTEARFEHPRIAGRDPRGTGCALSTAIAAALAHGYPLATACERAILGLAECIARPGSRTTACDWLR